MVRWLFLHFCWLLNRVHLTSVAAALRKFVHTRFASHAKQWKYLAPHRVGGWKGGIDVKPFGTVLFIDKDGNMTYEW